MKTLASISSLVGVTLIFAGVFTYDPLTALGAVIAATSGLYMFKE